MTSQAMSVRGSTTLSNVVGNPVFTIQEQLTIMARFIMSESTQFQTEIESLNTRVDFLDNGNHELRNEIYKTKRELAKHQAQKKIEELNKNLTVTNGLLALPGIAGTSGMLSAMSAAYVAEGLSAAAGTVCFLGLPILAIVQLIRHSPTYAAKIETIARIELDIWILSNFPELMENESLKQEMDDLFKECRETFNEMVKLEILAASHSRKNPSLGRDTTFHDNDWRYTRLQSTEAALKVAQANYQAAYAKIYGRKDYFIAKVDEVFYPTIV